MNYMKRQHQNYHYLLDDVIDFEFTVPCELYLNLQKIEHRWLLVTPLSIKEEGQDTIFEKQLAGLYLLFLLSLGLTEQQLRARWTHLFTMKALLGFIHCSRPLKVNQSINKYILNFLLPNLLDIDTDYQRKLQWIVYKQVEAVQMLFGKQYKL